MPGTLFQLTTMFHEILEERTFMRTAWLFGLEGLVQRGKGVPLKGPFFAHFSQGNFAKVNEIVHFSVFRIFCYFWTPLGHWHFRPSFLFGFHCIMERTPKMILNLSLPGKEININKERGIQRGTPHPSMNHFHKSDRRLEGEKD